MKATLMHLKRILTGILLILSPVTAFGTVPMPDLVLYGKVFQNGTPVTTDMTASEPTPISITMKLNGDTGPEAPVFAETAELFPLDNPDVGELYVLRLKRENGLVRTMDRHAISGDVLHIFLNGVEVAETSLNIVMVAGTPSEVVLLNLNDPDTGGSGYDSWADSFGLAGDDRDPRADPDADMIINFLERQFGLNPAVPDGHGRFPSASVIEDAGNPYLFFTYVRLINSPSTEDNVQLATDLTTMWDGSETETEPVGQPVNLGDGTERVTVRYATPLNQSPHATLFLRVIFVETPP